MKLEKRLIVVWEPQELYCCFSLMIYGTAEFSLGKSSALMRLIKREFFLRAFSALKLCFQITLQIGFLTPEPLQTPYVQGADLWWQMTVVLSSVVKLGAIYTTQMPMAASPRVCLDAVNTRLYRPADWQSLMIGFVGYDNPDQLNWLTAGGILCVCLFGRGDQMWDLEQWSHFFYGWYKAHSEVNERAPPAQAVMKWSTQRS